jgi:hypothetical protein
MEVLLLILGALAAPLAFARHRWAHRSRLMISKPHNELVGSYIQFRCGVRRDEYWPALRESGDSHHTAEPPSTKDDNLISFAP